MKQLWLLMILAAAACSACSANGDGRESFGDKREWSILQTREYAARQHLVSAPTFSSADGYVLLTVPSLDRSKNIWVMLFPKSPPFYKQLPQGNYAISHSLLDAIAKQRVASSTVQEALASHVTK